MQVVDFVLNNPDAFVIRGLVFLGVFAVALGFRRFAYRLLDRWGGCPGRC